MLSAKTFIVTGANAGVGKEIARGIAKQGHRVILACRDATKAGSAVDDIVASGVPRDNLHVMLVDLSSQKSVHNFANEVKSKYPTIHGLVNNAAVGGMEKKQYSVDGIELTFATNVIGYFLMCTLLSEPLVNGAPSRIVNVASDGAGGLNINDINFETRPYSSLEAYRNSKQADRMLSWILADKLADKNVTVTACTPGVNSTQLLKNFGVGGGGKPQDGAKTPIWLATSQEVEGLTNKYFESKREKTCNFRDEKQMNLLWSKLVELTKYIIHFN